MPRPSTLRRPTFRAAAGLALLLVASCCGADGGANPTLDRVLRQAERLGTRVAAWYAATPPPERIPIGGLVACGVLGTITLLERSLRLRRRRVLPGHFLKRLKDRLEDVRLERGKVLDLCELNPSPASRVALATVKRWGRPTVDLERAMSLACRVEADRLRRNVGTLRRVAAIAPLLGLLGTLLAAGRALNTPNVAWGPAIATTLGALTAGVAMSILSLVAYDGLRSRVEKLVGDLERLGAETVDAIALAVPPEPARPATPHGYVHEPHAPHPQPQRRSSHGGYHRPPHQQQIRVDIPNAIARAMEDDDLYDDI
jgi:biopolymer transport protein ExbB